MHAGVRDYLCDFCGKGFLRYNHWAVHMKRHRNEKNYDCDECDKKFITNADLLRCAKDGNLLFDDSLLS